MVTFDRLEALGDARSQDLEVDMLLNCMFDELNAVLQCALQCLRVPDGPKSLRIGTKFDV